MKSLNDFTKLYSLSKTLRFELKPVGKTLENIQKHGILENDNQRAKSYVEVKKIIDKYHKHFIDESLADFKFDIKEVNKNEEDRKDHLKEFYTLYTCGSKNEKQKKQFEDIQTNLRKQIVEQFKKNEKFKRLFSKELVREDLLNFIRTQEYESTKDLIEQIQEFRDFTTYFTGFHENRENMYKSEAKPTAIAYRLIHENLPKFIDNIQVFGKVASSKVSENFSELQANLGEYLNVVEISDIFKLDYFKDVLTQKQIDVYNAVIGGKTLEDGTKLKGLNEYINLYNQQQQDKSARLPKLKPLYKQILSDRNAISWLPEKFIDDNEVLEAIQQAYQNLDEQVLNQNQSGEYSLKQILQELDTFNLDKIFISNDQQLTDLSQKIFGHWGIINRALFEELKKNVSKKSKKETDEAYEERLNKIIKSQDSISIGQINQSVQTLIPESSNNIQNYFSMLGAIDTDSLQTENLFAQIDNAYTEIKDLLNTSYPSDKNLTQDKKNVEKIKNLLDAIKSLQHFVKPLLGNGTEPEKDEKFYGEFLSLYKELDKITPLYNMVRNYMTRKPYSSEKIKLHFENNSKILNGWVESKTEKSDNGTQYGGYLFRKRNAINEYDYFLGISSDTKLFRTDNTIKVSDISEYERLNYYQIKAQTIYSNSYKGDNDYTYESNQIIYAINSVIHKFGDDDLKLKINQKKDDKITASGYLTYLKNNSNIYDKIITDANFISKNNQLIKSIKTTLCSLDRIPQAKEIAKKDFVLFIDLMNEVEEMVKEKVFIYIPISNNEFEHATTRTNRPLYLFKISNKDLSFAESYSKNQREKRGLDNLHTMYFKALMEGNQNVFDIGTGAVYFRKKTLNYTAEKMQYGHHYDELKHKFPYPIISKKRYAYDQFQFHLSIVQNYKMNKNKEVDLNQLTKEYIKTSNDIHIIGIDRGERNLLYVTVIDSNGRIKEQFSLNKISNKYKEVNYHDILSKREDKRLKQRQSWQTIENIKDLKEGYLSQVIYKISELMVKYNAIVVLEDLNMGFMRGRQKVESSVYQKFEKMLIDKLNYLVDKKKQPKDLGGVLNAYQLTNKFESFKKLGKQSGFLFYVPAWNTSKIDPTTGFVNLFDTRYETREKAKVFFCKFDSIRYNAEKGWFEFAFDYSKFTTKADGTRTNWTVCTYGKRIENFRDETRNSQWNSREIDLTEEFKSLFSKFDIDIHGNLKESILNQNSADFFKSLLYLLKLTLQMRNSHTGTDIDYMQSPVQNEQGEFFNSNTCDSSLPQNADANGAYNIARKGLLIVRKIKDSKKLKDLNLSISNKEWLQFAQNKPYLNE